MTRIGNPHNHVESLCVKCIYPCAHEPCYGPSFTTVRQDWHYVGLTWSHLGIQLAARLTSGSVQ